MNYEEMNPLSIRCHTSIVGTIMENIIPLIVKWPHPNPLCDFLCREGKTDLPGPVFSNLTDLEFGNLVLRYSLNMPFIAKSTKQDIITVLKVNEMSSGYIKVVEKKNRKMLQSLDDVLGKADELGDIIDALKYFMLENKKNVVIKQAGEDAIMMVEDGATSIYQPMNPFYVQLNKIKALPTINPDHCKSDIPDVLQKGFLEGLKDFGKSLLDSAIGLAKADVKGFNTGALSAAEGIKPGEGAIDPRGVGMRIITGAVAGAVGASTGKSVKDVIDSVGGDKKKT